MPFEPEQGERKVATYVGLPDGLTLDRVDILVGGILGEWADYAVVHWGVRVEWDLDMDGPPVEWPSITFREMRGPNPADVIAHTYQLWLIQAYRPSYPLAAERRWHPDLGVRDGIVGLEEQGASRNDVLAAWRGHELIMEHLRRGGGQPRLEDTPEGQANLRLVQRIEEYHRKHKKNGVTLYAAAEVYGIKGDAERRKFRQWRKRLRELEEGGKVFPL